MARVAWQFAGYSWDVNPEEDSGWVPEHVEQEQVPIRATKSSIQYGGTKSARRRISGWLYGPSAEDQYNRMNGWFRNRTISTLVDHMGESSSARLVRFNPSRVVSNTEWKAGRSTWKYDAEFIEI